MEFEWDVNKNEANKQKHKISFERAVQVFSDPNKVNYESDIESVEKRFIVLGEIFDVLYSVIYTIREPFVRIISARRANEKERKKYYKL